MDASTGNSILDEIQADVEQMSDEELAKAAQEIQARNERARARVTPETKAKMKEREKKRRLTNAAILKAAKAKGLVAGTDATA